LYYFGLNAVVNLPPVPVFKGLQLLHFACGSYFVTLMLIAMYAFTYSSYHFIF